MTTVSELGFGVRVHSVAAGVEQYVIESAGLASRGRSGEAVAMRAKAETRRDLITTIMIDVWLLWYDREVMV